MGHSRPSVGLWHLPTALLKILHFIFSPVSKTSTMCVSGSQPVSLSGKVHLLRLYDQLKPSHLIRLPELAGVTASLMVPIAKDFTWAFIISRVSVSSWGRDSA